MGTRFLITHGRVFPFGRNPRMIEDGAVAVEDGFIRDVGTTQELTARYPDWDLVDARGQIVMPGLIVAHTHFYGTFARGMYIPGPPMKNFPEILARLWWQLDRALDEEGVRYSALVPIVDAIKHGATTLFDHHASNRFVEGSLDVIADAVLESGVRAVLCYEVSDRDGPEVAEAGIRENVRFIKRVREEKHPRLAATFGLHAAMTLSDKTLDRCVAEAQSVGHSGFHIHVAEGPFDQDVSLERYQQRVVDRLYRHGILGPDTIVAHAIDVDAWELEVLRDTETWVSHQPRSNMNNAVGVADVPTMLRGNMKVVLGNDGFSNNMFTEMHVAYLLHKVHRRDPRVLPADQVIQIQFQNNARLASHFFPFTVGELSPGAVADIIFLDYDPPTPLTVENFPWHVIFGVDGTQVTTTIVQGRFLMRDRVLLTLDEEAIMARAREVARATWERFWALSESA
ncbi:MAG: putative aminohydrolase SsnA [Chloroflexi bacterium]|nr:putative aminohydrolase SsnA [Chloroflexota bacterium]